MKKETLAQVPEIRSFQGRAETLLKIYNGVLL